MKAPSLRISISGLHSQEICKLRIEDDQVKGEGPMINVNNKPAMIEAWEATIC
jgi:hypothetical protein